MEQTTATATATPAAAKLTLPEVNRIILEALTEENIAPLFLDFDDFTDSATEEGQETLRQEKDRVQDGINMILGLPPVSSLIAKAAAGENIERQEIEACFGAIKEKSPCNSILELYDSYKQLMELLRDNSPIKQ